MLCENHEFKPDIIAVMTRAPKRSGMNFLRHCASLAIVFAFLVYICRAQDSMATYTNPLPTGVSLDPVGDAIDVGSVPLGLALSPDGQAAAVVLSGWREQGVQIVDLKSQKVVQTLEQHAAFLGVVFSHDGRAIYVSGGNDDSIFCYAFENGSAKLDHKIVLGQQKPDKTGSRYSAGIALSKSGDYLYVAENVADDVAVVDLKKQRVVQRVKTDHYPYTVEVAANGKAYVSAWGGNAVSVFIIKKNGELKEAGNVTVGRHPSALASNASGSRLLVALGGADQIAIVDTAAQKVLQTLSDSAPQAPSEGSTPNALSLSKDGMKLFVAEGDNDAVAVFSVSEGSPSKLLGRLPTDWYPTGVLESGSQLYVLSGKGHGSHANPDGPIPGQLEHPKMAYDLGQLNGTLRILPADSVTSNLTESSKRVEVANRWQEPRLEKRYPPFRHVIYIIKENRTYDQVFGDIQGGDGDPKLAFFGQDISPNHHALARRFGLFDRFFTNAEVSSQGHMWSTAAYVTDYDEKNVHSMYSDRHADIDNDEADEPANGFLWNLATKKGIAFRDYGEMVNNPKSPEWAATERRGLSGHINMDYPSFNLAVSDQRRADIWLADFKQFVEKNDLPQLEILHLPNDHTAGGKAGFHTPKALMADNDFALGRIVDAVSHSPFWKDTVIFVLEDDSQNGPDHVDSHRSPLFAISAYSRGGTIHRFANTTDVVAAIEDILSLDRLSKFDYFSRSLADAFTDNPDPTPYDALKPTWDMNEMNAANTAAARASANIDLTDEDRVPDDQFNRILWGMMKGDTPMPGMKDMSPLHAYAASQP